MDTVLAVYSQSDRTRNRKTCFENVQKIEQEDYLTVPLYLYRPLQLILHFSIDKIYEERRLLYAKYVTLCEWYQYKYNIPGPDRKCVYVYVDRHFYVDVSSCVISKLFSFSSASFSRCVVDFFFVAGSRADANRSSVE